jgi:hypothetical protein
MTTAKAGNMNIFYTGAPPHNKRKYELGYTPVYGTVDVPQFKYVLGSVTTIDDSAGIKRQSVGSANWTLPRLVDTIKRVGLS